MKSSILRAAFSLRTLLFGSAFLVAHAFGNTVTVHVGPSADFMSYSPKTVSINVGDSVQWVWDSSPHSVTSNGQPNGNFNSGILTSSATYSHTVPTAANPGYFCMIPGV